MFTARYGLSPYITQISFDFERLTREERKAFQNTGKTVTFLDPAHDSVGYVLQNLLGRSSSETFVFSNYLTELFDREISSEHCRRENLDSCTVAVDLKIHFPSCAQAINSVSFRLQFSLSL